MEDLCQPSLVKVAASMHYQGMQMSNRSPLPSLMTWEWTCQKLLQRDCYGNKIEGHAENENILNIEISIFVFLYYL